MPILNKFAGSKKSDGTVIYKNNTTASTTFPSIIPPSSSYSVNNGSWVNTGDNTVAANTITIPAQSTLKIKYPQYDYGVNIVQDEIINIPPTTTTFTGSSVWTSEYNGDINVLLIGGGGGGGAGAYCDTADDYNTHIGSNGNNGGTSTAFGLNALGGGGGNGGGYYSGTAGVSYSGSASNGNGSSGGGGGSTGTSYGNGGRGGHSREPFAAAGGGGGSAMKISTTVSVKKGQSYQIVIGGGGSGGTNSYSSQYNGSGGGEGVCIINP